MVKVIDFRTREILQDTEDETIPVVNPSSVNPIKELLSEFNPENCDSLLMLYVNTDGVLALASASTSALTREYVYWLLASAQRLLLESAENDY